MTTAVQYNYPTINGKKLTIAMMKVHLVKEIKEGEFISVLLGASKCHPDDRFDKRIGRAVALGRCHLFNVGCVGKIGNTSLFVCRELNLMLKFKGEHLFEVSTPNFFV